MPADEEIQADLCLSNRSLYILRCVATLVHENQKPSER
jgi:hypothetical protein